MTKEQKDKILKALAEDRNEYARECNERIEKEYGKIAGADYMLQRFLDVLKTEIELSKSGEEVCKDCYFDDGEVHAECVICRQRQAESEDKE